MLVFLFVTLCTGSGPVESLQATAVSPTTLAISWSPPTISNGIINFNILSYRQLSIGGCSETPLEWIRLQRILPNETETSLIDLLPYSKYEVKVMVKTNAGRGQAAFVNGTTSSMGKISHLYIVVTLCTNALKYYNYFNALLKICSSCEASVASN